MAMTLEEMELETAEYVPAREVMCTVWYQPPCHPAPQPCHPQPCQPVSHPCQPTVSQSSSGVYYAQGGNGISILSGDNILDGNNVSLGL
jgi:hypothetical protein